MRFFLLLSFALCSLQSAHASLPLPNCEAARMSHAAKMEAMDQLIAATKELTQDYENLRSDIEKYVQEKPYLDEEARKARADEILRRDDELRARKKVLEDLHECIRR